MPKLSSVFTVSNCYSLLLAITPFIFLKHFSDPVQTPVFLYLLVICFAFQLSLLRKPASIQPPEGLFNREIILLVLLLSIGVISSVLNHGNTESLYELARTASLLIFFYTNVMFISSSEKGLRKLVLGIAAGSVIYLGFALSQAFELGNDFFNADMTYSITAHLGHRNLMANYFALSLPLFAYPYLTEEKRWLKFSALFFLVLSCLFLILLGSRVGWMGLAGFLGVCLLAVIKSFRTISLKTIRLPIALGALSIILVLVVIYNRPQTVHDLKQKARSFINFKKEVNENTFTVNERFSLWKKSISLVSSDMFFGMGPGLWKFKYPVVGLEGTRAQSGIILFQRPHNDLIWYLNEYGIPGLLVFLLLLGMPLSFAFSKMNTQPFHAYLVISGILIFLMVCFFDFPKERPAHLFLLSFYLSVAAVRFPSHFNLNISYRHLRNTMLVLSGIVMLFFAVRAVGEYHLNQALANRILGRPVEMQENIANASKYAVEYDLTGTPLEFYLGEASFYAGNLEGSVAYFKTALQKNPYHLYSLSDLGSCYYVMHKNEDAFETWGRAIKIAPSFAEARLNISIAHYQAGELNRAMNNLQFEILAEDAQTYKTQITVIYTNQILALSDSVEEPFLRDKLNYMASNEKWIFDLYKKMIKRKDSPAKTAVYEALWTLEKMDKKISAADTRNALKKYDRLFR